MEGEGERTGPLLVSKKQQDRRLMLQEYLKKKDKQ
jgi:hypothetical protein